MKDICFGSFNLYNLQRPGKAMYYRTLRWTPQQYQRKVQWSGGVLRRLKADCVGFQELWAKEALDDVLAEAGLAASHTTLVPASHNGRGIVCAAVVRTDLLVGEPQWITDFPSEMVLASGGDDPQTESISVQLKSFSRPVLHCRLRVHPDTPEIHLFVCHFKSRRPTDLWREPWYDRSLHGPHQQALGYALSTVRRTAEAAALRMIITQQTKGTAVPVVVVGDMNDGKHSNTLNIMTEQPNYLNPLSSGGSDNALYTAQTLQEYRSTRDVYYTHVHQRARESLDHILVSEQFYDHSKKRLWAFDALTIENDHLDFDDHKTEGTGDHGIVRASFKWKPAAGAPGA